MLSHLPLLTLQATYIAQKAGQLPPYLGSTFRGLLGHCLRDFSCAHPKERCHLCAERQACLYAQCFCSPGNAGGAVNSFVLQVITQGKTDWQPGDSCVMAITLIGQLTEKAGVFLDALRAIEGYGWGSARLPFRLASVVDQEDNTLIICGSQSWLRNLRPHIIAVPQREARVALVRFDSPVRILTGSKLCQELPFDVLVHSVSRRLALLSQAYSQYAVNWDYDSMLAAAKQIQVVQAHWRAVDFERYSMNHRGNKLALPAITGWALYQGDLAPFTPILAVGQRLHAGKNATIGFGHYTVAYDK